MKKFIALMALAPVTLLAAQTNTSNVQIQKANNITKDSEDNREDKKLMLTAEILGVSSGTSSQALEAAYYINSDLLANVRFTNLQKGLNNTDSEDSSYYGPGDKAADELWDEAGGGYILSAGIKKFVGNSFYVKPEAYYRKQKYVAQTVNDYSELLSARAGEYTDIGLSVKIGNQWQWESFTIGCDWIGLNQTVSTIEESGNLKDSDIPTLSALNFYMGASF